MYRVDFINNLTIFKFLFLIRYKKSNKIKTAYERDKQIDISKLKYCLLNNSLNHLLQFYFSNYLPELMQVICFIYFLMLENASVLKTKNVMSYAFFYKIYLNIFISFFLTSFKYQNGNMDNFVTEIFHALAIKESENSRFVIEIYDDKNISPKSEDKIQVTYLKIKMANKINIIL